MTRQHPRLWWAVGLGLILCALLPRAADAGGYGPADSWAALEWAAARHQVSYRVMVNVAACETGHTMNPRARGDWSRSLGRYRSFGIYQLNDRATGLIWHFYDVGFDDADDPYQAASYFAGVLAGKYRGIKASRWTCWRIHYG